MTIRELIDLLLPMDDRRTVVLSKDEEGNDYHDLGRVHLCKYRPEVFRGKRLGCGDIGIGKEDLTAEEQ